jgi:hypothetical protein
VTPYAEALEEQIRLARWCDTQHAASLALEYSGPKGFGTRKSDGRAVDALDVLSRWKEALTEATPFYWSPTMCDLVVAAESGLRGMVLEEALFPAFAGYCHFARRPVLTELPEEWQSATAGDCEMAGVAWYPTTDSVSKRRLVTFTTFDSVTGERRAIPTSMLPWFLGDSLETTVGLCVRVGMGAHADRLAQKLRLIGSMLLLLDQTIAVATPRRVDRAAARRAEREKWTAEPIVRVVELRRRVSSASSDGEHGDVDWSCRWIVRGHWRQQWCPAAREHRPIWITPYVKGPEEKPLKPPRATVFAVVR